MEKSGAKLLSGVGLSPRFRRGDREEGCSAWRAPNGLLGDRDVFPWSMPSVSQNLSGTSGRCTQASVRMGFLSKSGKRLKPHLVSIRHQNRNKESLKQNKEEFGRAGKLDPVMTMRSETFPGTCRHHGKGTRHF